MPIHLIITCSAILLVLQGLSLFLKNLEIAAKQIEGRSTWIARDGTVFEEFGVTELNTSLIMQREFEESNSEVVPAGALTAHASI